MARRYPRLQPSVCFAIHLFGSVDGPAPVRSAGLPHVVWASSREPRVKTPTPRLKPTARRASFFRSIVGTGTFLATAGLFLGFYAIRAHRDPDLRSAVRIEGDWMMAEDPEIGYVAAKNASSLRRLLAVLPGGAHGFADPYHVYTDARGARVNERGEQTPSRVDLLTVGCSFSWGHGLENESTFTEQLKRRLGVSGANLALASYSGLHALQMLKRNLDLKPKVIVYGYMDQHLKRNLRPCAPSNAPFCLPQAYVSFDEQDKPYIHPPHTEYDSEALNREYYADVLTSDARLSSRDVLWEIRRDFFRLTHRRELATFDDPPHQVLAMDFVLQGMLEAARSVSAKLVVVYIPIFPGEPPPRALLGALKGIDLNLVDLHPRFRKWSPDSKHPTLSLSLADGHPNATAHELIAEELLAVIPSLIRTPGVEERRSMATRTGAPAKNP
jgi:hypothetical protein